MIDPFFLESGEDSMHEEVAPQLPRIIILNNRIDTTRFIERIENFQYLDLDLRLVLSEIIEILQREEDAEYQLSYEWSEKFPVDVEHIVNKDLEAFLHLRDWYAKKLLAHLRESQLYVHGMLFYQIHDVTKAGVVLERFDIPLLHSPDLLLQSQEITRYGRQVNLAHRRSVSRASTEGQMLSPLLTPTSKMFR